MEVCIDLLQWCMAHPFTTIGFVIATVLWMLAYYPEDDQDDEKV